MAQHDFVINNQGFAAFRSDLNDFLSAVKTTHSGTSLPSGAAAGTIWLDTTSATTPTLKYYDGADNISLATIDHVGNTVNWLDSTVSVTGISTTATATVLTLTDSSTTQAVNLIIDNQKEIRFRETTANGTNYVALKAPASVSSDLTFTLPATDGTANQALVTDGSGVLSFASVTGRTGTVDWCTTAKTAPFTAVNGDGFFVNTTCGAVTVTLPSTPTAGDIVAFKDYASQWNTNNVTLCNNGNKINGVCATAKLSTQNQSVSLIYVDATKGWQDIQDSTAGVTGGSYITATGGTITTCGDYKIHTFTSDGTFCVSAGLGPLAKVDYLVVAGGGSASRISSPVNSIFNNGGGGAGGYRESHCATISGCYTASPLASSTSLQLSVQGYPITVGGGGTSGSSGSNSVFSTITSAGGGAGGVGPQIAGLNGGSGGGGYYNCGSGGSGNTPPVSPPQGNNGGTGATPYLSNGAGGGGGATAVGANGNSGAGPGGAGATSSISTAPVTRAGGGGGGSGGGTAGSGGPGGGGAGATGATPVSTQGTPGTANTGGGGGGSSDYITSGNPAGAATGGSGLVIIRYKFQ